MKISDAWTGALAGKLGIARKPQFEADNRATRRRWEKGLGSRSKAPRNIASRKPKRRG